MTQAGIIQWPRRQGRGHKVDNIDVTLKHLIQGKACQYCTQYRLNISQVVCGKFADIQSDGQV